MKGPLALALAGLLLPACWITKAAEHMATVQFLAPAEGAGTAILRAHGDRVVVFFLTDQPMLEGLPDRLLSAGIDRVEDAVFLVTPRDAVLLPAGLTWRRVRLPTEETRVSTVAGAAPEVQTVSGIEDLEVPGILIRLIPTEGPDSRVRILVDARHAGHRILLAPVGGPVDEDLRLAATELDVDLVGLLSRNQVGTLEDQPGLQSATFVVTGPNGTFSPRLTPLDIGSRRLFRSSSGGLVELPLIEGRDP